MWNTKTSLDGDVAPLFTICINFSFRTHIMISSVVENPEIWKQAVNMWIGLFRMLGPVGGMFWSSGVNHLLGRCCQVWVALLGAVPAGWAWSGPGSAGSSPSSSAAGFKPDWFYWTFSGLIWSPINFSIFVFKFSSQLKSPQKHYPDWAPIEMDHEGPLIKSIKNN